MLHSHLYETRLQNKPSFDEMFGVSFYNIRSLVLIGMFVDLVIRVGLRDDLWHPVRLSCLPLNLACRIIA